LVFRIGTRVFLHAPTPAGRSTTILWNLQPAALALIVNVRAVLPGRGGASIRIRCRSGQDADWRVEGPSTFRPQDGRLMRRSPVSTHPSGPGVCHLSDVPLADDGDDVEAPLCASARSWPLSEAQTDRDAEVQSGQGA
jgi:hypothetical protein